MNIENIVNSKVYALFDWIYKLLMLNLIWIGFTIGGFVIFSIVPATITVYLILKDTIKGKDVRIFKSFAKIFFSNQYVKSQKLMIILLLFFGIIGFNYYIFANSDILSRFSSIALIIIGIINYIGIMTTIHIFPIFIYFPYLTVRKSIKYAFLFSFSLPIQTILMLIILITSLVLGFLLPFYFFLFGISAVVLLHLYIIRFKYENFNSQGMPLCVENFMN
ncbi:DUF624 domain-containing protein [Haloplasma contractile]|nr:DUF624 domain-containing protein [Haloplasma contractile]